METQNIEKTKFIETLKNKKDALFSYISNSRTKRGNWNLKRRYSF